MRDWNKVPDAEPYPGAADAWWEAHATTDEKAAYDWIRENASLEGPPVMFDHNGIAVRPGTTLPEWHYRQKYPKHLKRYIDSMSGKLRGRNN